MPTEDRHILSVTKCSLEIL